MIKNKFSHLLHSSEKAEENFRRAIVLDVVYTQHKISFSMQTIGLQTIEVTFR